MNQFEINRVSTAIYLFWLTFHTLLGPTIAQDEENESPNPTNDQLQPIVSSTTALAMKNSTPSAQAHDQIIEDIFNQPNFNIYNPTPSMPPFYPTYYPSQQPLATQSDKLFEFSLKKKFFPFGALSLDIKRYKNDVRSEQAQPQHHLKPTFEASPNLILPESEATMQYATTKPSSNYFSNLINHSFNWGAIVKVPGIAIQKFGKFGLNIFSGTTAASHGHGGSNLIAGQMPPYGLIDERGHLK